MQMMKRLVAASVVVGGIGTLYAETLTVETNVDEAILYTNQADIHHTASLDVPSAGEHQLRIATSKSDVDALSIDIDGAELLNYSIVAGDELITSEQDKALVQAQQRLKLVNRAMTDNANLRTALANRLETAETDIDDVMNRMENLRQDYEQLLEKEQAIKQEIERLQALKDWVGDDFYPQPRADEPLPQEDLTKTLVVNIHAEQAGPVFLSLRERTGNAFWQPISQWHLDTEAGEIDILGQAQIYQRTGDDWQDVTITLAVMPLQYHFLPEFFPQTVSYVADKLSKGNESLRSSMAAPVVEFAADASMMKGAAPQPIIEGKGGNFQVTMPSSYSLSSGSDSHLLTYYHEHVAVDDMFSAYYSWNWPQEVLLIANWTQPGNMPLLAGDMKLLRDDLHLISYNFNDIMTPGSEWRLSFGVDARFDAESILPPEYKEENGFIRRDTLVKKEETYRVTNLSEETLPVRIYARLPVSTEEGIEIKPTWSPKPDAIDVDDVKGMVYWMQELAPEEELSVEHGYEIRHPEDKKITTSR